MSIYSHRIFVLVALVGCGKDDHRNNAMPDGATNMTPDGPAACSCSPAAVCRDTGCSCPAAFIAATSPVIASQMLAPPAAGYISGGDSVTGTDGNYHSVVVTASQTAPLNQAVPVGTGVYVGVGYDYSSATSARSIYVANGGTVTLTRRCATGIAGTLTNVTLVEANYQTLVPLPDGCTTTLSSFTFDVGGPCT